jgi:hypothetical protein
MGRSRAAPFRLALPLFRHVLIQFLTQLLPEPAGGWAALKLLSLSSCNVHGRMWQLRYDLILATSHAAD